jgi:hypothetical protein
VGLGAGVFDGIDFVGDADGVAVGVSGVLVNVSKGLAVTSGVTVLTAVRELCSVITAPWQATKNITTIEVPTRRKSFVFNDGDISLTQCGMFQNPTTSPLSKQVFHQKTGDLFIKPSLDADKVLMLLCQKPETIV